MSNFWDEAGGSLCYSDCRWFGCFPFCKVASGSLVSGCSLLSLGKRENLPLQATQRRKFNSTPCLHSPWCGLTGMCRLIIIAINILQEAAENRVSTVAAWAGPCPGLGSSCPVASATGRMVATAGLSSWSQSWSPSDGLCSFSTSHFHVHICLWVNPNPLHLCQRQDARPSSPEHTYFPSLWILQLVTVRLISWFDTSELICPDIIWDCYSAFNSHSPLIQFFFCFFHLPFLILLQFRFCKAAAVTRFARISFWSGLRCSAGGEQLGLLQVELTVTPMPETVAQCFPL